LKKIIAVLALVIAPAAYAACTTSSIMVNGKMLFCTTCCAGGHCTTNCV
jgi:hypothetical protein